MATKNQNKISPLDFYHKIIKSKPSLSTKNNFKVQSQTIFWASDKPTSKISTSTRIGNPKKKKKTISPRLLPQIINQNLPYAQKQLQSSEFKVQT